MTLTERELAIAANMVRQRRGDWAAAWICGRIAQLEKTGDVAGADAWAAVLGMVGEIESGKVEALQ